MTILEEIINTDFETKDDIVVMLGKAVQEDEKLRNELAETISERDRLSDEVNSLKAKNVDLLAMIPTVVETETKTGDDVEDITEAVTLDDIFKADMERGDE